MNRLTELIKSSSTTNADIFQVGFNVYFYDSAYLYNFRYTDNMINGDYRGVIKSKIITKLQDKGENQKLFLHLQKKMNSGLWFI